MSEGPVQEVLHSRADVVFNVTLVLAIVATVFVGLRITSKWIVVKRNNSDDVFTIIAWVSDTLIYGIYGEWKDETDDRC